MQEPLDISKFLDNHRKLDHVHYELGEKAESLSQDPATIRFLDCSGYARVQVFQCTDTHEKIPDGSWNQRDWCEKNLRQLKQYSDVQYAANDPKRIFICFIKPTATTAGHVWFVYMGKTYECHGGKKGNGVDSRSWTYFNTQGFKARGLVAFELVAKP